MVPLAKAEAIALQPDAAVLDDQHAGDVLRLHIGRSID